MTMVQTPINNPSPSVVTPTFSVTPTIQTSSSADVKRNSPSLVSTNLFNSKNLRITPRPIKPKGRGRGQSSLTRSVMEQLKLINRTDNEKQNDNNGTFTPVLTKPSNETSKSQIQILPQSTSQMSIQHRQIQPQLRPQIMQPQLSANKSSVTPIPIAPKPSVQQQQKKIIAEEMQALKVSHIREDRSASPIIDPGSNNETISKEDIVMEMDVESNEVKKSHDISSEEENSIVIENDNQSTNSTITPINGNVTSDTNGNVKNINTTDTTDFVSNTNEDKGLEQIQN
jgi:hypothetical protein